MIARYQWALGATVLLLAACASPRELAFAPSGDSVLPIAAEADAGGISVSVRWPARQVQAIPAETTRIVLRALLAGTVAKEATLLRSGGESTSTASLKPLALGTYTLAADAYDAGNEVVASGSVEVTLRANELVRPTLALSLVDRPVITSMSQVNGVPGESVILRGTGFGATKSRPYSVYVGGVQATAVRSDDGYISMVIPATATNSPVVVNVGTGTAQSTASFSTIRSLAFASAGATVSHPATVDFAVTARDYDSGAIADPIVPWSLESAVCSGNCLSAATLGQISASGRYTTNGELGRVVLRAGRTGSVTATASIVVQ